MKNITFAKCNYENKPEKTIQITDRQMNAKDAVYWYYYPTDHQLRSEISQSTPAC